MSSLNWIRNIAGKVPRRYAARHCEEASGYELLIVNSQGIDARREPDAQSMSHADLVGSSQTPPPLSVPSRDMESSQVCISRPATSNNKLILVRNQFMSASRKTDPVSIRQSKPVGTVPQRTILLTLWSDK